MRVATTLGARHRAQTVGFLGPGDLDDLWLIGGAERFCRDVDVHHALLKLAKHSDSRMCLVLLGKILDNPGLADRLMDVLKPEPPAPAPGNGKRRKRS